MKIKPSRSTGGGGPDRGRFRQPLMVQLAALVAWWAALLLSQGIPAAQSFPGTAPTIVSTNRQLTTHPAAFKPSGPNLVVIIHGYLDNTNAATAANDVTRAYGLTADGWVPRLNTAIQGRMPAGWGDVWMYNWSEDAFGLYNTAAKRAMNQGDALGLAISRLGYRHVHLISHSLGSEVSERAAYWIQVLTTGLNGPETTVHQTFLDGVNIHAASYGQYATLAEQYYIDEKRLQNHVGDPYRSAYNIDLSWVNPYNTTTAALDAHRFPREWYELGIAGAAGGSTTPAPPPGNAKPAPPIRFLPIPQSLYSLVGYGFSKEVADLPTPAKPWPPATYNTTLGTKQSIVYNTETSQYNLGRVTQVTAFAGSAPEAVASEVRGERTGSVAVVPDTVANPITPASSISLAAEAMPGTTNQAALVILVDTTATVTDTNLPAFINSLSFDYTFNGAETNGLNGVSVFMPDATGTNWVDIRDVYQQLVLPDGTGPTAEVTFTPLPPGQYAFAFALDASYGTAMVTITNLQFGLSATAPMLFTNPPITSFGFTNGAFSVSFPSASLCGYVVESADSLLDPLWQPVEQVTGNAAQLTVTDTNTPGTTRFYRVRVQ